MALHNNGFPQAHVGNISFLSHGLFIDEISLDANGFSTVQNIQIEGKWLDLSLKQHAQKISIKSIELTGELDENKRLTIAGWDGKLGSANKTTGAQLPFQSLYLDGVTLDLSTPVGAIRTQAKATLQTDPHGKQVLNATLWSGQKQFTTSLNIAGALDKDGTLTGKIDITDTSVDIPPLSLSRVSGWAEFKIGATSSVVGQIMAGGMQYNNKPFEDVNLTFDTAQKTIAVLKTKMTGQDLSLGAELKLEPERHIQLSTSSKNLGGLAALADIENDLLTNSGRVDIHAKINLIDGFQPEKKISVDAIKTSFGGGNISLRPFNYYLDGRQQNMVLDISGVKLSQLTGKEPSVIATGSVSGSLPLSFKTAQDLAIHKGVLKSDQPGSFRYAPKEMPAALQGNDPRMETVRLALSNYHYQTLEMTIDGLVNGDLKTNLIAKGASPVFEGRPVNLNLNLEGALAASLRQALQPGALSDRIEKNLNKGAR